MTNELPPLLLQSFAAEYAKEVCDNEPEYVERYHEGKLSIISYLLGKALKLSKGSENPGLMKEVLLKEIESRR